MIFLCNAQGTITSVIPEPINQGSIGVNRIVLIAPYPKSTVISATFTLPNGMKLYPQYVGKGESTDYDYLMSAVESFDGKGLNIDGVTVNVWQLTLDKALTQLAGNVKVQFLAMGDGGVVLGSTSAEMPINRGNAYLNPSVTAADLNSIAEYLNAAENAVVEAEGFKNDSEGYADAAKGYAEETKLNADRYSPWDVVATQEIALSVLEGMPYRGLKSYLFLNVDFTALNLNNFINGDGIPQINIAPSVEKVEFRGCKFEDAQGNYLTLKFYYSGSQCSFSGAKGDELIIDGFTDVIDCRANIIMDSEYVAACDANVLNDCMCVTDSAASEFTRCLFVDPYTVNGFVPVEDVGKVPTLTASGEYEPAALAHKIAVKVNNTNYELTVDLIDFNNNVISTGSVDLPIESMIIGATINGDGDLVLTLQNGQSITVPVSDLVSGLASEDWVREQLENVVGGIYTPSVSSAGVLSWTNNKDLPNPSPVNIRGPQGVPGSNYILTESDKEEIAGIVVAPAVNEINTAKTGALDAIEDAKDAVLADLAIAGDIVQTTGTSETAVMSQKATSGAIQDVNRRFDLRYDIPKMFDTSEYPNTIEMSRSIISDKIILRGSYIDSITLYSGSTSGTNAYIYVIDAATNECMRRYTFLCHNGKNVIPINFFVDKDCKIATYGSSPLYTTKTIGTIDPDYVWSTKLQTISPKDPSLGAVVSITESYGSDFVFAISCNVMNGAASEINNTQFITEPRVIETPTFYNTAASGSAFIISDKRIAAGSFVKSIRYYSRGSSGTVYIYFIDTNTKTVTYRKITSAVTGWNIVLIEHQCDAECQIGIYGALLNYRIDGIDGNIISEEQVFSIGILQSSTKPANVGDVLEITQTDADKKAAFQIQWDYVKNLIKANTETLITNNTSKCIISFIDDDGGTYVPEIWENIINQTGIRMGFACITGFMSRELTPSNNAYIPMTIEQLKQLYHEGHEVYSHAYSHPSFETATSETITEECWKSRNWLGENGFVRGSDIIVYPGGMGATRLAQQEVVKQFYRYGVDAYGGVNPYPIEHWRIVRVNADTGTLEELKAKVDEAVAGKRLLAFMNHAYEINKDKTAQIAKMVSLIEYIKTKDAIILPIGEALHRILGW